MVAIFEWGILKNTFYLNQDDFCETISRCFSWINSNEGYNATLNYNGLKEAFAWMKSGLSQYHYENDGFIPEDSSTWVASIAMTACVLKDTINTSTPLNEIIEKDMKIDIFYRIFLVASTIDVEIIKSASSPKNMILFSHYSHWDETNISEAIDNLCQQRDTNLMILSATNLLRNFLGKDDVDYPDEYLLPD